MRYSWEDGVTFMSLHIHFSEEREPLAKPLVVEVNMIQYSGSPPKRRVLIRIWNYVRPNAPKEFPPQINLTFSTDHVGTMGLVALKDARIMDNTVKDLI